MLLEILPSAQETQLLGSEEPTSEHQEGHNVKDFSLPCPAE